MNSDVNQPQIIKDSSPFVQYNTTSEDTPMIHHTPYPGGVYQGEMDNHTRSGLGLFLWNNGDSYFGSWHSNKMHGKGVFCFNTGIYIEGTFISDFVHGPAAIHYPDHSFIEGIFTKGKLSGRALLYDSVQDLWFIQDYKNQNEIVLEGKGKPNYSDYSGILYEYLQKNIQNNDDLMNLKLDSIKKHQISQIRGPYLGCFEMAPEIRHFGLWDANQLQGLGIRISRKSIESGHYQNNKLNGIGHKIRFGDFLYKGELKDGIFNGQGTLFDWKTKIRFKGTFINGKPLQSALETSFTLDDLQTLNTYLEYVNPLDKTTLNNLSIKNYIRTFPLQNQSSNNNQQQEIPQEHVVYTIDQKELSAVYQASKSKERAKSEMKKAKPETINFDIDLNDFSLDVQDLAFKMDKSPENIEKALDISRKCIDYLQTKLQNYRTMPRSQKAYIDANGKLAFEQPFSRAFSIAVKQNPSHAPQRAKSRDSTPSVVTLTFQDNQSVPKLSFHLNNSNTAGAGTKRSRGSRKETRERYSHVDSVKLETFAQDLNLQEEKEPEIPKVVEDQQNKPPPPITITSEISPRIHNHLVHKLSPTNTLHAQVQEKLISSKLSSTFAPKTSSRASITTESDLVEYNLTTARGGISARSPQQTAFPDSQFTGSKELNLPANTKPWTPRTLSIELIPESSDENVQNTTSPTPMNHLKTSGFQNHHSSINSSSTIKRKSTFEKLEQSITSTKANTFVSIKDLPTPTGAIALRANEKGPLTDRPKVNSFAEQNESGFHSKKPSIVISDQEINTLLGKVLQPSSSAINLYGKSEQSKPSRIIRNKGSFQGLGLNEIKYSMEPKEKTPKEKKMFPLSRMLSSQTPSYKENNPLFPSKLTSPKSYLEGKSLEKKTNLESKHSYRSTLQTDRPSSTISAKTNKPDVTSLSSPKAAIENFKQTLNLKGIKIFENQFAPALERATKTCRANTPKVSSVTKPTENSKINTTITVAAQQAQARRLSLPKNSAQVGKFGHHLRRNSSGVCLQNFALDLPKSKSNRYSDVSPYKTVSNLCSPRQQSNKKENSELSRRLSIQDHNHEEAPESYYPVKKTCDPICSDHIDGNSKTSSPKFQTPKHQPHEPVFVKNFDQNRPIIVIENKEEGDLDKESSDTEIIEENYDRTPHPDFLKIIKSTDVEFPAEEKLNVSQKSESFRLYDQLLKKNFYFQKEEPIKEELFHLNKKYPALQIREVGESLADSYESSQDTLIKKYSIGIGMKSPKDYSDILKGKSATSFYKQDNSTTIMREEGSDSGKAPSKPSIQSTDESHHKKISFHLSSPESDLQTLLSNKNKNKKKTADVEKMAQAQSLNEGLRNLFHGKKSSLNALNLLISQNNSIKDKFSTLVTFGGGGTNQSEMTIDGLFADPNDFNVMSSPKNVQTLYKQAAPLLLKKTHQEQKASYAEHRKDKIKSCTIELQPSKPLETKQFQKNLKLHETKKHNNLRYQEEPFQATTNVGSLGSVTNKVRPSPLFNSDPSEGDYEQPAKSRITEDFDIPDERMDHSNSCIIPVKNPGEKESFIPIDSVRSPIKQKTESETEDRYSEILTERTPEKLENGEIVGSIIGMKKANF